MQMRTRGPAGAAAQRDFLPALYLFSFLNFELGKMQVKRQQSLAVIQHHKAAFEIEWTRQKNRAVIHRRNRRSAGHAEIQALMGTRRLAIKNSHRTENIRDRSFYRCGKLP